MKRLKRPDELPYPRRCLVRKDDHPEAHKCFKISVVEIMDNPVFGAPYSRAHALQVLKGLARELGYEVKKVPSSK